MVWTEVVVAAVGLETAAVWADADAAALRC